MNRGSAADPVARLGVILVGAAALVSGCAGLARWEPVPLRVAEARGAADAGPMPEFAAVPGSVAVRESRGFGLNVGIVSAPLGGMGSVLSDALPAQYSDAFDNGMGLGASFIMRRPAAGTVSAGDIYLLGGFEALIFGGKEVLGWQLDDAMVVGLWLDAKTMMGSVGASGAWKPYVLTGLGIVVFTETLVSDVVIIDFSIDLGVRGKIGVEWRTGKLGLYADVGVQVSGGPDLSNEPPAPGGNSEPMIYTPISAGLLINF
ncbi:MAG: hypothetical protein ACYTKD_05195 [Planctomycetota bacterium]|jgi:hypothetical protein